jgi:nicotinate-nucleotide adenylyltransferase
MKIGLFFGSFNPVHNGHIALAKYMIEHTDLDCVWFVISPHNPLKDKNSLLDKSERLKMVNMSLVGLDKMRASDIEFNLPQPSYTIDTINVLTERFKENEFVILMGIDNLENFHKWKDYQKILDKCEIFVYSRSTGNVGQFENHPKIKVLNTPLVEISSTFIREEIKNNRDVKRILSPHVLGYIERKGFYK